MVRDKTALNRTLRAVALAGVVVSALTVGGTQAMAAEETTSTAATAAHAFGPLGPLTDLVVQRLRVGDEVAASKFGTDKPIDDPAREQQELAAVRTRAFAHGLDPERTAEFFQDQITASKVVQRGLFARWTAHPEEAPTTRPDLTEIRAELDELTTALLTELVATNDVREPGTACRIDALEAQISADVVDHLDELHRGALRTALQSLC
ncbi:chorismate mutase [Amycolatopsis rhabdoformis]|uniref:chorismate mutase n=1 Tax=Amycolatopsis rhabdoformis TaxID=1448059 RepID=A0ABZ1I3Y2_9PSEU|nr:chorismate mutase [Amycolatopsis rhabdoformis]WSE29100.1 chorismate mutase [Amycolatopsis rhabdoformis]